MRGAHQIWGGLPAAALVLAGLAGAEPLNLSDTTPRWVEVSFERSPADRPGQRGVAWSPPVPAWLRPAERSGWVLVAIPPRVVEREVFADQDPVPGSFGPFVWVFDTRTGHVVAAEVEGAVHRRVDLGFVRPRLRVEISVRMGTERVAGYRQASVLGLRHPEHCAPAEESACTLVAPVPYDPVTGYVNAVGPVEARAKRIVTRSFSALGEARFSERTPRELLAVSSTP